jgi:hypothetical protein
MKAGNGSFFKKITVFTSVRMICSCFGTFILGLQFCHSGWRLLSIDVLTIFSNFSAITAGRRPLLEAISYSQCVGRGIFAWNFPWVISRGRLVASRILDQEICTY